MVQSSDNDDRIGVWLRDQFDPKENLRLDRLTGIDDAMADAVSLKFLPAPLTKAQQDELFKYYARATK